MAKDKDYEYIKDRYGEKMAQFCRSKFPTILDKPGFLSQILDETFAHSRSIYNDIHNNVDEQNFFITEILKSWDNKKTKEDSIEIDGTPEELMRRAGYILFPECEGEYDIQGFKKYYDYSEELCTFYSIDRGGSSRVKSCRVWFAVKISELKDKDIEYYGIKLTEEEKLLRQNKLNRDDFRGKEQREDEYGTSVLSIQFTRDKPTRLSIKNRYNDSVCNPDATFGNCLDCIIGGLSKSFYKNYNIGLSGKYRTESTQNYVKDEDGKYYKRNINSSGIDFCENNTIIVSGKAHKFDEGRYVLVGSYLIDRQEKTIKKVAAKDIYVDDEIVNKQMILEQLDYPIFNDIAVLKDKTTGGKHIELVADNGEKLVLDIDIANKVVNLNDPFVTEIKGDYFGNLNMINNYSAENLVRIGNWWGFLNDTPYLETVNLPNLIDVQGEFLCRSNIKEFYMPDLQNVNGGFLSSTPKLESASLPSYTRARSHAFTCSGVKEIYMPNIQSAGNDFLSYTENLEIADFPNLINVGNSFLVGSKIKQLNVPNVKTAGEECLSSTNYLEIANLPSLTIVGDDCMLGSGVKKANFSNLKKAGLWFLCDAKNIEYVDLSSLEDAGGWLLCDSNPDVAVKGNVKKDGFLWVVCNSNKKIESYDK